MSELSTTTAREGMRIEALSQWQLARRRFFRHRGALAGLITLSVITLLAFSSIGFGPFPGWWGKNYATIYPLQGSGGMTLDIFPSFIDGDGMMVGEYPFGQDNIGRDFFALTMRGAQRSLIIAFLLGFLSTVIGVVIGALSGYFGKLTDSVLMRLTDLLLTIPLLVIAAVVARRVGEQGIVVLAVFLSVLTWMGLARLVRAEFLSLREKEFVEAARAMGATSRRIIFRHILPNVLGIVIVSATFAISSAILLESTLSYLGFGVQPPDTSLGLLISQYQNAFATRPWLFWWPGLFIVGVALSVNFIGDGLRDAFDPKQNRVR